jgi:hypothetical protein
MEPYVVAGLIIFVTFLIGAGLVKRMYDTRTQEPQIDVDEIIGLDLPEGVDLQDALGGVFK